MHVHEFDLLGIRLRMAANDAALLRPFTVLLGSFRSAQGTSHSNSSPAQCMIELHSLGARSQRLSINGDSFDIRGGPSDLVAHAYSVLFDSAFTHADDQLLIHGSAVSFDGLVTIICGPSGFGKTTLSHALCETLGASFLSDDVAAVQRSTGSVEPFPKALSIRAGIAEGSLLAQATELAVLDGQAKRLLSAEQLGLVVATDAMPLGRIIFLGGASPGDARELSGSLVVALHRCPTELVESARQLEGVELERVDAEGRYPQIRFKTKVPARALRDVQRICRQHGALIIGSSVQADHLKPQFRGAPTMGPLPMIDACRRVIQSLWGSAQYESLGMSGTRLFSEVARLLKGCDLVLLQPGAYDETLAAVQQTVSQRPGNQV